MAGVESSENWHDLDEARRGLIREVNERIAHLSSGFAEQSSGSLAQFTCECSDPTCIEPVTVTLGVYEHVRAEPRRYLIALNHEDPETETVIVAGAHHAIVETLAGQASKIAETTDPRRRARLTELRTERKNRPVTPPPAEGAA
jgi:hypothetical protein